MTPEEANAVNVVCSYLAGKDDPMPREVAPALEMLASRAHNRIQAGWDEAAVRKQWPEMPEGPSAEYGDGVSRRPRSGSKSNRRDDSGQRREQP